MTLELFARAEREELAPGACVLRGLAFADDVELKRALAAIAAAAPFRHMITPGGFRMSVAMTNCGRYGWVSDEQGYRYATLDPVSGRPWPALPPVFTALAAKSAALAGFTAFAPDACLVNRYEPRARLTLHRDKDERDFGQPIVSVSLGVPATFLFGGVKRRDRVARVALEHGDVVVWGGPSRLRYHGVAALKPAQHPFAGEARINLTLRCAR
ncbi:MAG TPA: DNA oxidative demethylase AlkB [Gammaproteobacteria bacterium]|nr:DNA oxidative demethylase AlkB [Gammaproteobacteria bacterium]